MTGDELHNAINYTGQERAARKLALDSKLVNADAAALMTSREICDVLAKEFEMVATEGERITLVRKADVGAYLKLVKCLDR